jgi:MscS family membrane protein
MDLVEQAGAAFAFPSRTLYLGSDRGPDERKALEAEARVREWRDEGSLPFPNFSPEQAGQIRGSVVYPPPGSTAEPAARSGSEARSPGYPPSAEDLADDHARVGRPKRT